MARQAIGILCFTVLCLPCEAQAAGDRLYGVHWWDYANPSVGNRPESGWSVETVVTESDVWWRGPWFVPLYQQVTTTYNADVITRIDYNWGQTVPAPASASAQQWANTIITEVIAPLGPYSRRWVIGNEPNLVPEATGWPAGRITPDGYAAIYNTVRQAIKVARPQDEVLFAPVSPGGVIAGVRWKEGNQWLAEAIDATLALPDGAIDGFALHSYGNPFAGAAQAATEFHNTLVSQLAVIDSRSLTDVPVYVTEWNRSTSTTGDLAANEQVSADFLRMSLAAVDTWNRTPGNHNVRAMAWFVGNKDYGGWDQYSLEWWQSRGNPVGTSGDLWTALMGSSALSAGLTGKRPQADYNSDGLVTVADADAWRAAFGRNDWPFADGNHNGWVDAADYVIWRDSLSNFDSKAQSLHVPEARSVAYLVIGLCCAGGTRRTIGRQLSLNAASQRRKRLSRIFSGSGCLDGNDNALGAARRIVLRR